MKRTNTAADVLNTNIARIDVGDGIVIPLPADGSFGGGKGEKGEGIPEGGAPLQVVRKSAAGTTTEWVTLTPATVGLTKVDNTADAEKPISEPQRQVLDNKADLLDGKVVASQLPEITPVTDSTIAPLINGATTGAAIDERINTQVAPQVQKITSDFIAGDRAVVDAAAAAVNANPKILQIEEDLTNRVATTDRQAGQKVGSGSEPGYTHAWADKDGRVGFALRKESGVGILPGGLETIRAGAAVEAGYSWAVVDKGGRVSEMALGPDGRIPQRTLSAWASRMGVSPGGSGGTEGTRLAGVAVTLPDTTAPNTTYTNVSARIPLQIGARAGRWRVHIRNYNDKSGTTYSGALAFTGVSIGTPQRQNGELDGSFTGAPRQVAGPFNTSEDGAEWVSPWVEDHPLEAGRDYMLSYGFTSAAGQANYMASAGGWMASATDVNTINPARGMVRTVPLDVWLEVEVPASTRVIAYLGDSLSLGISATLPVHDSWPAKHAVANGVIHTVYAIGGSQFTDWMDTSARRISKWSDMSRPDATVIALGNNDIFAGVGLDAMKARLIAGIGMVRSRFSQNVYLATVLPRIGANAGQEQVRKDFNEWMLTTLPGGARMVFDFAAAVEASNGSDASLRWASAANNFHLSSAGYARCAATITQRLA